MIVFILFATLSLDFKLIGATREMPFRLIESTTSALRDQSNPPLAGMSKQVQTSMPSSESTIAPNSNRVTFRNQRHRRTRISQCQNGRCTP